MSWNTKITKLLGIDYPIIQGGMAYISDGVLAAAMNHAGCAGVIGSGGFSVDEIRDHIRLKLTPDILHFSPNLSSVWNIVRQGIAISILTGNGIMPASGLVAIPIEGLFQKGFIVTKKGRQIYADERCLIDFVQHKFTVE